MKTQKHFTKLKNTGKKKDISQKPTNEISTTSNDFYRSDISLIRHTF